MFMEVKNNLKLIFSYLKLNVKKGMEIQAFFLDANYNDDTK